MIRLGFQHFLKNVYRCGLVAVLLAIQRRDRKIDLHIQPIRMRLYELPKDRERFVVFVSTHQSNTTIVGCNVAGCRRARACFLRTADG